MPKGGSILANFRLRKMEQNAVAARAAAQQHRNEESQAYMLQEQRERNEWAAEQERERLEAQQYQQRMMNVRLRHERLIKNLRSNQERRYTKRNPKKLYRNTGTSRNLLRRRAVQNVPNWGF